MYTIKQIADQVGKSQRTVRGWLKRALAEHDDFGTFAEGQRRFSAEEVEILKGYGRNSSDKATSDTEVIEPELIDNPVSVMPGAIAPAKQVIEFDIRPVALTVEQLDFTQLQIAGDQYTGSTENAFGGLAEFMAGALKNQINLALAQNQIAVNAAQAYAANQAMQKLGESQGHTGLAQ